jgi:hypothetical protein
VLLFLLEHAPLENWQHDLLEIVREEAYYFAPQRQTKIMNEGWAVFAHTHLMTERYALEPDELIDYADHHSGTVAVHPGRSTPTSWAMSSSWISKTAGTGGLSVRNTKPATTMNSAGSGIKAGSGAPEGVRGAPDL